jgi:hypothetical protein
MDDRDDLNNLSLTGKVWGPVEKAITTEGCLMCFTLTVSKILKGSGAVKLSNFKVVLFDGLAAKNEDGIFDGQTVLVQGELDETKYFKGGKTNREIRVVGRFVKILGAS